MDDLTWQDLVDRLGGSQKAMAKRLDDLVPSTMSQWKKRGIPRYMRHQIVQASSPRVTLKQLEPLLSTPKERT